MPNTDYHIYSLPLIDGIPFTCQHVDTTPKPGHLGEYLWDPCNNAAGYLLTFKGELTGLKHEKHLCQRHAQPYLDAFPLEAN